MEFPDDPRGNSVKVATGASSFPGGGFDLTAVKTGSVPASRFTIVSVVKTMPPGLSGNCIEIEHCLLKRKIILFFVVKNGKFWNICYLFIFLEYIWFTHLVLLAEVYDGL